jgi:MFS family permease
LSGPADLPATGGPGRRWAWVSRTVLGIVLATFFSDASHEAATAVLPLYLATIGLGPAALGLMEGVADFCGSVAKLAGGWLGHHVENKRPWASLGYLVTALATAALGLVGGVASLVSLRSVAWTARGFRSPLRDFLLADAVEPTHFGRAYGLERMGDMLGAVTGPVLAAGAIAIGLQLRPLMLWTVVPGVAAAAAMFFLARPAGSRAAPVPSAAAAPARAPGARPRFPARFWLFLVGVLLFGLGDFSRTFLILLAAGGGADLSMTGNLSFAVLLYMLHNLVAAVVAYPVGRLGDRVPKLRVLVAGYALGVATNVLLAGAVGHMPLIVLAILLSGVYYSVEETIEKAAAAELLPRELRSLGFGILASANAIGDVAASVGVGLLLQRGEPRLAFGLAAGAGALGVTWLLVALRPPALSPPASPSAR